LTGPPAIKPQSYRPQIASFRDPAGKLISVERGILRLVNSSSVADLLAFLASSVTQALQQQGRLVKTRVLEAAEASLYLRNVDFPISPDMLVLEHQQVTFRSFPYEWPPEMLHAAGTLTIELARAFVDEGFCLKDATPYNVLFEGPNPVFVDVLSFQKRDPCEFTWLAYGQLVRTFLLPLALNKHCNNPLGSFLAKRDGFEPEAVYQQLRLWNKLKPPFLTLATLPRWLSLSSRSNTGVSVRQRRAGAEKARFILSMLLNRTSRTLRKLEPNASLASNWCSYSFLNNYTTQGLGAKRRFVEEALREYSSKRLLDVGSNLGQYSEIAAKVGCAVVAIDSDPVVCGRLWRRARSEKLNILPLVVDFSRPSPAVGWRNQESESFLDRARGQFDTVLMLAIVHHLLTTERIPLQEIADLSAELTTKMLLVEFVPPDDTMFRQLSRGREALHADLDTNSFETAFRKHFVIVRSLQIEGTGRKLYLLRKP
jgi:SAM-dependent methyltransferase